MSRFLKPSEPADGPKLRRSIYEDRLGPGRECVRVADTNPLTGELEWEPDWARRVSLWTPLDEFMRERAGFGGGLW
jgi:hypothetical protein